MACPDQAWPKRSEAGLVIDISATHLPLRFALVVFEFGAWIKPKITTAINSFGVTQKKSERVFISFPDSYPQPVEHGFRKEAQYTSFCCLTDALIPYTNKN